MTYADHIRSVVNRATADDWANGTDWYRTANATAERLASEYHVTHETAARVIAVLSPRKRWGDNIRAAERVIRHYSERHVFAPYIEGCFSANVAKAWHILSGRADALSGPKVTRFYANIMGDDSEVTVDVWAARAASDGVIEAPTTTQYHEIADAYRAVAREFNVSASALQAVAWIVVRGSHS